MKTRDMRSIVSTSLPFTPIPANITSMMAKNLPRVIIGLGSSASEISCGRSLSSASLPSEQVRRSRVMSCMRLVSRIRQPGI